MRLTSAQTAAEMAPTRRPARQRAPLVAPAPSAAERPTDTRAASRICGVLSRPETRQHASLETLLHEPCMDGMHGMSGWRPADTHERRRSGTRRSGRGAPPLRSSPRACAPPQPKRRERVRRALCALRLCRLRDRLRQQVRHRGGGGQRVRPAAPRRQLREQGGQQKDCRERARPARRRQHRRRRRRQAQRSGASAAHRAHDAPRE